MGGTVTATISFNVEAPTSLSVTGSAGESPASLAATRVSPYPQDPSFFTLSLGDSGSIMSSDKGLYLIASATKPSAVSSSSKFLWVQLLQAAYYRLNSTGRKKCVLSAFVPTQTDPGKATRAALDTHFPYVMSDIVEDSPSITTADAELAQAFSATMYLMFDPALPAGCVPAHVESGLAIPSSCTMSIPVPLGYVTYKADGDAVNTRNPSAKLLCPTTRSSAAPFIPSTIWPVWQDRADASQTITCNPY